jgi:RND family efflux transporter MFP subunit
MRTPCLPSAVPLAAALIGAAAVLTACGKTEPVAAGPRPVYVTTAAPANTADLRTFTATVRARVESDIGFRTGGKVVARLIDVGTRVRAGQALARLDASDYALGVQAAEDQVRAARVDAEQSASDEARFGRLAAEGSVGSADHERQKARADAAAARLDQAQRQLALARNRDSYATLLAPYDGVVTAVRFEAGQVVAEGQPVLSLARDGEREIVADIPEAWVDRARNAVPHLTVNAADKLAPLPLPLHLRELAPTASALGRTFRARFAATPASRDALDRLPLGSTAQLSLASKQAGDRGVVVPVTALVKGSGPAGVWAIDDAGNGLSFVPVQVQAVEESNLRVTGLAQGRRVVSVGAQKLDAGLRVRAIERPGAPPTDLVTRSGS